VYEYDRGSPRGVGLVDLLLLAGGDGRHVIAP
jgi:hypothetical protein